MIDVSVRNGCNGFLLTCLLSSFQVMPLMTNDSAIAFSASNSHHTQIERFESELKHRYGAAGEPSTNWTLAERMAFHDVPAFSIAVAIDGKLVWAKAYGQLVKGSNEVPDTNTLFQAASLSKPIASIAALQLVDNNKVTLDAPVNQYLKTWQIPENEFTREMPVTLRHLLSHRAGTTIHGFKGYMSSAGIPSSVQIVTGTPPANTQPVEVNQVPGSGYRYSGGGYQIAQLLIEDVTTKPYAQHVKDTVFTPLSLTRSNFGYPQQDKNVAIGHVGASSTPIPEDGFIYPELAAAGLWTTPTELVLIGSALAKDKRGGNRLLSTALVNQLIPDSTDNAGLGFGLNNDGDGVAFVHNGHNPGFSARWISYADGRASVAVLTNSDTGGQLIREVLSAIGDIYGWKQDAYIERQVIKITNDWAQTVIGDYYYDESSSEPTATISLQDNALWIEGEITERTRLYPISTSAFFIANGLNMTLITEKDTGEVSLDVEGELQLVKR